MLIILYIAHCSLSLTHFITPAMWNGFSLSSIILLHFKFNFISISTLHLALFELRCCFCCRQFSIFIFNLRNCKLTIAFLKFNFQFLRCGFCLTHDCWCVCFYSYCFYCYCCCCAALLFWLANHQRIVMSKATIVNLSKAKQQYRKKQKKPKQSKVNKKKNSNIRIPFRYSYAPSHCKWKLLARTHTNILTMEMDVNVHARFTCCTLMWFRQSFVALLMRKCRFNGMRNRFTCHRQFPLCTAL